MPIKRFAAGLVLGTLVLGLATCGGDERPALPAAADADRAQPARTVRLRTVAGGLERPTHVSAAPGDGRGLWVLEQPGRVLRLRGERRRTVLDLRHEVVLGAEQGLLGLAFHPGFARNRRFYVDYTDRGGDTRVAEYRLRRDGRATAASRRELLHVDQPEENHNGGALAFGPDGRLYVGMGDGGGAFDPRNNAQDDGSRLGKVLAADVDAPGRPRWDIMLRGLRNPWRMWFDPAMNELWIGDVGQDHEEEVDRVPLELDEPPKNLGWPAYEGEWRFDDRELESGELVAPVATYSHDEGCSVTGGLIYRGTAIPGLSERYVFGDFCTGRLWSLRPKPGGGAGGLRVERVRIPQLTHIGADAHGELVFTTGDGRVLRAVPA